VSPASLECVSFCADGTCDHLPVHGAPCHPPCILPGSCIWLSSHAAQVTEASRGTTAATPDASSNAAAAAAGLGDAGADSETGRGPANSSSRPGVEGEGGQQGPGSSSQEGIWVVCQLFKEG
jgi:hypothetical protein